MYRILLCAVALAMAASARGQDAREELEQLRGRVDQLEKQAAAKPATNAFNPDISLILQGSVARSSQNPDDYQITGFMPSSANSAGEVAPAPRGFSLGESELVISSNIDPYFRGQLVASFTPDNQLEVEEAFFQTLALGRGFTLKGGRFLSSVGYQNQIHQHAWDFQDAALAYKAFLGGRLNDDGLQLKWLAPTELLVELGAEVGRGRSFPGSDTNRNGAGMWALYGHLGGDVGESTAWRTGLSYLRASASDRGFDDRDAAGNPVSGAFSGRSSLWIADVIVKWAPRGDATVTNLKLQGEYFRRSESGDLSLNSTPADYASRQSGWYAQSVYQFMPRWRIGYRYDRLGYGSVSAAGFTSAEASILLTAHNPTRNSVMMDWSPTEFSRVRVQLARDNSRAGVTDNQALVQYIFSLGAHGAHTF
jgi:hypothetical protein